MTMVAPTPYDTVAYPGHTYDYTHPDRLATVAALYGMRPTPLSKCRVLELGCGGGENLIPVAYQWPDSEFVGIDLSRGAIAQGQANIAALGLDNIVLHHRNIMDVGAEIGRFDYIIAHGVYSWVPAPVREKMLSLFSQQLTPHGVVYVSYNSQPGSHLRNLTREIMRLHVAGFDDPLQRIAQARAILKVVSELSAADELHGMVLRAEHERVSKMSDEVLFHDDLSDQNDAFLLSEVVAAAERHGLQYLSDATFFRADLQHVSEPVRQLLQRFPENEVVAREQYQDFVEGHSFRRTLLCRADIDLKRTLTQDCVRRFQLDAEAVPEDSAADPLGEGVVTFKIERANRLSTDHLLSKAAVLYLGQVWPATVAFPDLIEAALALLGEAAGLIRARLDDEVETLTHILFRASCAGHVGLHLYPPKLTTQLGEKPRASLLARRQSEAGSLIVNLQHGTVSLEDPVIRQFLRLLDGTRTVDDLVADLAAALEREGETSAPADGAAAPAAREVTRAGVEHNLRLLARLGLLEA